MKLEEVELILNQLVQAFRYEKLETYTPEKPISGSEPVELKDFLFEWAKKSVNVFCGLHWILFCEKENKSNKPVIQNHFKQIYS